MNRDHLSAWEQDEYILEEGTPDILRHLTECSECRASVERLQEGIACFRSAAMDWSAECLAERPTQKQFQFVPRRVSHALRWVFAALIPLLLLVLTLTLIPSHRSTPPQPVAQLSDDELINQVDEQVAIEVPSSMESLTHLVSAEGNSGTGTPAAGSKRLVQNN